LTLKVCSHSSNGISRIDGRLREKPALLTKISIVPRPETRPLDQTPAVLAVTHVFGKTQSSTAQASNQPRRSSGLIAQYRQHRQGKRVRVAGETLVFRFQNQSFKRLGLRRRRFPGAPNMGPPCTLLGRSAASPVYSGARSAVPRRQSTGHSLVPGNPSPPLLGKLLSAREASQKTSPRPSAYPNGHADVFSAMKRPAGIWPREAPALIQ